MEKISLKFSNNTDATAYEVLVGSGLFSKLGECLRELGISGKAAVVTDRSLEMTFAEQALAALNKSGFQTFIHIPPSGEENKSIESVLGMYEAFIKNQLERGSVVVALGGGVVGDSAGFAASTYMRGMPFVQCPTTLLAMVDASVGGKVGVNLRQGKNLIGSFYQPRLVVADVDALSTLPKREFVSGLAECVKHAVIRDAELFTWIGENLESILALDKDVLIELVARNVRIKAAVVMADEKETGEREHLNFGHTFAHAIEKTAGYGKIKHGEAVSLGMVAATATAVAEGICDKDLLEMLTNLLKRIGLPVIAELSFPDELMRVMQLDKKVKQGRVRLILPRSLGEVFVTDAATTENIYEGLAAIRK